MPEAGPWLQGECYCREVAYAVADAFEYALFCHCKDCQRTTGSAFKPIGGIRSEHLRITRGEDLIRRLGEATAHNAFCERCGSLLHSVVREGRYVHIPLGTLADAPSIRPSAHIFVRSKAPWHVIGDDLPQHETWPPDEGG